MANTKDELIYKLIEEDLKKAMSSIYRKIDYYIFFVPENEEQSIRINKLLSKDCE